MKLIAILFLMFRQTDSTLIKLDKYMHAAALYTGFNGNVIVARQGKVLYQKAFGFQNLETRAPLTNRSVFDVASVSKQFTAMGILLLEKQHRLKLSDSLRHYFPQLPYHGITIKNLLTHTSGLPDYFNLMADHWDHQKAAGNDDLIRLLAERHPPVFFRPGTHYRYCNTGYVLLASIIEKVSGQRYARFIAGNIFRPLKMTESAASKDEARPNLAEGYTYADSSRGFVKPQTLPKFALVSYLAHITGDGSIYTTTGDLLKWDRALANHLLLPAALQDSMLAPHVLADTLNSFYYGYGVVSGKNSLGPFISHEGIWPGYRAYLVRYTVPDITIAVLSNNESNAVGTAVALAYIANGREVIPPYRHSAVHIDSITVKRYTGYYHTPALIQLVYQSGRLIRRRSGGTDIGLLPESVTKFFYADGTDRQLEFSVDPMGKVLSASLISGGIRTPISGPER